jgi:hypothetical protein
MERGVNTHLTGNGAPIIHDFEIVFQGHTNVLAGMPYIILLAGFIGRFCNPAGNNVLLTRFLMAGLWKG